MVYLKFKMKFLSSKSLRSNLLPTIMDLGMGLKVFVVSNMFAIPSNFKFVLLNYRLFTS